MILIVNRCDLMENRRKKHLSGISLNDLKSHINVEAYDIIAFVESVHTSKTLLNYKELKNRSMGTFCVTGTNQKNLGEHLAETVIHNL